MKRPRPRSDKPSRRRAAAAAVCGGPAVLAFALGRWQIATRSFNQDEAATLSATRRPLPDLLRMLGHIDAVHGVYYLLIHVVVRLFGGSETAVRLPSVLATALAAGMLTALGRRLAGPRAGLAAGLLYAAAPPTASYAQDGRPFALATALTVISCYCFTAFTDHGGRGRAIGYAVALTVTGWVNILALLVLAANAVTLLVTPGLRDKRKGFAVAAAAALVATSPVLYLDATEVHQVAWEERPGLTALLGVLAMLAVAGLLTAMALRPGPRRDGRARLARLAAPWLMLPPVLLFAAAQITPMWELRYLLFCLPAVFLLVVAALPARAALAVTAAAAAALLAAQPLVRPAVAGDDLRAVSRLLQAQARPGDAVTFPQIGKRLIKDAYPAGFRHLRDVGLDRTPAHRNTLYGLNVGQRVLYQRLAGVRRVWVIQFPSSHPGRFYGTVYAPDAFCAEHTWQIPGNTVTLYRACG